MRKMKVNVDKEVNFCEWCAEVAIDRPLRCKHTDKHRNVCIKDCEIEVHKCKQCGTLGSHWNEIKLLLPWWVKYSIFETLGILKFHSFDSGRILICPVCKSELKRRRKVKM